MSNPNSALLDASHDIPSIQTLPDGAPRFRVPAPSSPTDAAAAAAGEEHGGVAAEWRVFLDAQLAAGDLLLDMSPGLGFVALSAATAPNGVATVFVAEPDAARLASLQDAAADAGAWLEGVPDASWDGIAELLDSRLEPDGRLFVHTSVEALAETVGRIARLPQATQFLALGVTMPRGEAAIEGAWTETTQLLREAGLVACTVVASGDAPVIVPLDTPESDCFLALPESLVSPVDEPVAEPVTPMEQAESPTPASELPKASSELSAEWDDGDPLFPTLAPAALRPSVYMPGAGDVSVSTLSTLDTSTAQPAGAAEAAATRLMDRGFSLLAPHSRTGYGVVGANLLRTLQQRGVPVAFFPIGPVDAGLVNNPHLSAALDAQGRFPDGAPSVRLAQQFDLALHAGRGPRVAFPIFESDRFSSRELHHLRAQDAVLVCTPWARDVCVANGLSADAVHVVPLGVDAEIFHPGVAASPSTEETVFLQMGKLESRKGQLALLRAFEAAFDTGSGVRMVLACHNPFQTRSDFEAALRPFRTSSMASQITILHEELASASDVAALMGTAHCGVFPVRAEGWNLEALEMLAMGKPVIASKSTGHTAYLTEDNARLITMGAPAVADGGAATTRWPTWGEAQHEQLVEALRAVHAERLGSESLVNAAGIATAQAHGWGRSATALLTALASLG